MATLNPYLNFYGRCTEAMNFYKEIFGGELSIQLAGDSPAKDQMPPHLHNQVMHSHLKSNATAHAKSLRNDSSVENI